MANFPTPDDRFYKKESLIKAFGVLSIVMLVSTLWMVLDDYGREWKGYQAEFMALKKGRAEKALEEAKAQIDPAAVQKAQEAVAAAQTGLKAKESEINRVEKELIQLRTKEKNAVTKFQSAKAVWDVEKYQYEAKWGHEIAEGHESHGPEAGLARQKVFDSLAKVMKLKDDANHLSQSAEDKEKESKSLMAEKSEAEKSLKVLNADVDRLVASKEASELTLHKLLRSAPLLDFADSVFKLKQIVVPTIRDDVYFAQLQKVDRCTSCHLAIDTPGFESEPQPFKTHPKLDLILGSRSPHPIDKIGCTVCHEGRGPSSHFVRAAHTPQSEEQKKAWEKKHHWHEMHHVIEKMIPLQYIEGKCRVCHRQTEYVPKAEKLNSSVQLVKAAGCYGCHRIEGWDHLRKPAPSLKRVKGKVTRDWIVKWVKNPQSFNENARMPAAFFQSNTNSEEFKAYQEAEAQAITDYVLSLSDEYRPSHTGQLGNAARGKEVFGTVGCLGCHNMDDYERKLGRFSLAPDLSTVGSKVNKDWLYSWLKNPKHYWSETTMPSLRLTDSEIADLTAYLSGKHNAEFDAQEAGTVDVEMQKKVLGLYLLRDPKFAPATDKRIAEHLSALSPAEVAEQLGKNGVTRYGCFGCHEIKGFETTQGIGTELTEEGSKPVNKFDFGLLHLDHSVVAWLDKKFENTRSFDEGIVKEYLDILRMPQYGFNKAERDSLITFILGLTSQKIDAPSAKILNASEAKIEDGMRVIHKYNCQGCHRVEMLHVELPQDHPKWEEHEAAKYNLEGRILKYYEEDTSLGPPPLVTQGARTKTAWTHAFLNNPLPKLRDKLQVRMPSFQMDNDEINTIVEGWGNTPGVEFPISQPTRIAMSPQRLAGARTLINRLQCLNCHTMGEMLTPAQMEGSKGLAPDFKKANKRLRRQWIIDLLKDPQKMIPETRMPGFWPDGQSPAPDILGGDSEAQLEAIADYLLYLGQGSVETVEAKP